LFFGRETVVQELLRDDAPFATAANHAEKGERLANPLAQHQRIVLMTARDDETERGRGRQRLAQDFFPSLDTKLRDGGKVLVVRECGAVVEHGHSKVELERERSDSLRDVAGAANP
jgi:hypothetical protein